MMPLQKFHKQDPNSIHRLNKLPVDEIEKVMGGKIVYTDDVDSLIIVKNPNGFYNVFNGNYAIESDGDWYILASSYFSEKLLENGLVSSSEIVFYQVSARMDYQYLFDKLIEEERVAKNLLIFEEFYSIAVLPELFGVVYELSVELVANDVYYKGVYLR